jgi:uncharacterized membrane protein YccC
MSINQEMRVESDRTAPGRLDLRSVRILRFALGVTIAAALAFAIEWPLSFLLPLLTAVFLGMPLPGMTARQLMMNAFYLLAAFVLGSVFTLILLPYPLVYVPLLGLALFHIYYLANRGGSFFLVLMSIIAILLLPMLAQTHKALATGVAQGFVGSGVLVLIMIWLSHRVLPDPLTDQSQTKRPGFQSGYSSVAAEAALKSTLVVLPLATVFIATEWSGQILVMIFAAIFTLSPQLAAGKSAGLKSLKATMAGGGVSLLFFYLLMAVPELHFFMVLLFLTALVFGLGIYSDRPSAPYYASSFTALLILVSTSMGEGADIESKFLMRILFIALASLYVVSALAVLDRFWPNKIPG